MSHRLFHALFVAGSLAFLVACEKAPEPPAGGLLQHVSADTPYAFVTSKLLPEDLRDRLGNHYAAQLASQRPAIERMRRQIESSEQAGEFAVGVAQLFDVLDAFFAELEGRDSAEDLRELGIEPVTRSAFYGIGLLPAVRVEIADAAKLRAMLDRVERRAGVDAGRAVHAGQDYRRIDLGGADAVLAVSDRYLVAGLLADELFERDLPLLLGSADPPRSLADSGDIQQLIARHAFTGYGEGFIKLDELIAALPGDVVVVFSSGAFDGLHERLIYALGDAIMPALPGDIAPIRELLDAGVQSDRGDRDERWEMAMREEVMGATVEISSVLGEATLPLRAIAALQVGDVIPLDVNDTVEVCVEELPICRGELGVHNNSYAVKVSEWIERSSARQLHDLLRPQQKRATDMVPQKRTTTGRDTQ